MNVCTCVYNCNTFTYKCNKGHFVAGQKISEREKVILLEAELRLMGGSVGLYRAKYSHPKCIVRA